MKILIVDDHALIRAHLRSFLEDHHHKVVEAYSGRKALELLEEEAEDQESIKAVITDCRMDGGSGVFLLQSMWRKGLLIPSLLHSSDATYHEDGHSFKLSEFVKAFNFARFHLKAIDGDFGYITDFLAGVQ